MRRFDQRAEDRLKAQALERIAVRKTALNFASKPRSEETKIARAVRASQTCRSKKKIPVTLAPVKFVSKVTQTET